MSASVRWNGLEELRAALRNLPKDLAGEASSIVQRAAADAAQEIRAGYQAHRRTGNLAEHVKVEALSVGPFGAGMAVKSTAKHAQIFERGTELRHTSLGANRGAMPPGRVFVPAVIRRRRTMYERLKALLISHGLTVRGDA